MAKKQFSSALDEKTLEEFKNNCAKYGISMNMVIEGLIKDFCKNDYSITITKSGIDLKKID